MVAELEATSSRRSQSLTLLRLDSQILRFFLLERFLRPEFLGRVDEIVIFNRLTFDNFEKIASLMLDELVPSLKDKGIDFVYDESVPVYLAKKAYGGKKGARSLRDAVRREVEEKLANAIVFNQDTKIERFTVSAKEGSVNVQIN